MIKNFANKFGSPEECTIILGDYDKENNMKGKEPKAYGLRCYTSRDDLSSPFGLSSKIILFDFFIFLFQFFTINANLFAERSEIKIN